MAMLNQRTTELQAERERLEEQRKLSQELAPISAGLEPDVFCEKMVTFTEQVEEATPEEMQRLLRLTVRRLEWMPNGEHRVEFHYLPDANPQRLITEKTSPDKAQNWLQTGIRTGCPWDSYVEPLCLIVPIIKGTVMEYRKSVFQHEIV